MNGRNDLTSLPMDRMEEKKYRFDYLPLFENGGAFQAVAIYQLGDLLTKPGFQIGQHVQHYHEICYIESGSGQFIVNGRAFPVNRGDLVIIRCNDTHDMITDDLNPMRVYYYEFFIKASARDQSPYSDIMFMLQSAAAGHNVSHHQYELEAVFAGLFREMDRQDRFYGSYMETCSVQLLIQVYRAFGQAEADGPVEAAQKASLAGEIARYIESNVEKLSELDVLGKVFNYSYSYLASLFREAMGISLFQYYDQKRFEKAVSLLCEGSASIGEIAERLQYQSVSAFSKAFKKRFGMSPSVYVSSYWNRQDYTPLYDKGKQLISGHGVADMCISGHVFYCAGSCVREVTGEDAAVRARGEPFRHSMGAAVYRGDDMDDM